MKRRLVPALLLVAGAIWEARALTDKTPGDSWSEQTRIWWRVDTTPGKYAFLVVWGTFTAWYAAHILKPGAHPQADN